MNERLGKYRPENPRRGTDKVNREVAPKTEKALPASAVAVVNESGQVLLIKRVNEHGGDWVYPGGGANPGESPLEAAIRELQEETGLILDPNKHKVFPIANYITAPDLSNQRHDLSIYAAHYSVEETAPAIVSPQEATEWGWFDPSDVLERTANGEMKMLPSGQYAVRRIKEYLSNEKVLGYAEVLMGGTFDRLHDGHRRLLEQAYAVGDYVYIGLTTDKYIEKSKKKLKGMVNPFEVRLANLREYLQAQGVLERTIILPLDDVAGPKAMDAKLGAIVLSEETTAGGSVINERRRLAGVPEMEVVIVPLLRDETNEVVSSTRLRESEAQSGQIDSNG